MNHIEKREEGIIIEIGKCKEHLCDCNGYGRVPHAKIRIEGLKEIYQIGENIAFSIHVRGYGSTLGLPDIWIRQIDITKREQDKKNAPKHELSYLTISTANVIRVVWKKLMSLQVTNKFSDFERIIKIPSGNESTIFINEHGNYELEVTVHPDVVKLEFEVK